MSMSTVLVRQAKGPRGDSALRRANVISVEGSTYRINYQGSKSVFAVDAKDIIGFDTLYRQSGMRRFGNTLPPQKSIPSAHSLAGRY